VSSTASPSSRRNGAPFGSPAARGVRAWLADVHRVALPAPPRASIIVDGVRVIVDEATPEQLEAHRRRIYLHSGLTIVFKERRDKRKTVAVKEVRGDHFTLGELELARDALAALIDERRREAEAASMRIDVTGAHARPPLGAAGCP